MKFHFCRQLDGMDCGPACLCMIAKHYGANYSIQELRDIACITRVGVSLLGISEASEKNWTTSNCCSNFFRIFCE